VRIAGSRWRIHYLDDSRGGGPPAGCGGQPGQRGMASQPLRITSIGGFILDDSVISGHKDVKVGLVAATLSIATGSGPCFGCCTVTN
jgi:hypothetical protein